MPHTVSQPALVEVILEAKALITICDHVEYPESFMVTGVGQPPEKKPVTNANLSAVSFGDTHRSPNGKRGRRRP